MTGYQLKQKDYFPKELMKFEKIDKIWSSPDQVFILSGNSFQIQLKIILFTSLDQEMDYHNSI